MAKSMEITVMGYIGIIGHVLELYWDSREENGNYYLIAGYVKGVVWG